MGDKTAISWTDATWNPVRGCSRVSEGCRHCYAEVQAARIVRMGKGKPTAYDGIVKLVGDEPRWTGKVAFDAAKLANPLRWRKPRRIFVNSMSDLFHEKLTNEQIAAVFGVMAAAPQHTFQCLTKRPKRMREWFAWIKIHGSVSRRCMDAAVDQVGSDLRPRFGGPAWPLPNVWLGVSVENQPAADERIPDLLATPAAARLLSCEPLLGRVDLRVVQHERTFEVDALTGDHGVNRPLAGRGPRIDWVIAGCESGPGARPCDVAWLRALRDQCAAAGVPYFLKQAVGYSTSRAVYPSKHAARVETVHVAAGSGSGRKPGGVDELPYLDGVQHAAFPEVRP